jgi:subtilase family serine protease
MKLESLFAFALSSAVVTAPLTVFHPALAAASPVGELRNAPQIGVPTPQQKMTFLVHLPLRNVAELNALVANQSTPGGPLYHHFLTPAQFRESYAPTPQTIARATAALAAHKLTVTRTTSQLLQVSGSVAATEAAFSTHLALTRDVRGAVAIGTREAVHLPSDLAALGATVHGLHQTIAPRSRARLVKQRNRDGEVGSGYWFTDLKQAYQYPSYNKYTGKGVTIATVNDQDFNSFDVQLYFGHEKLGSKPDSLAPAPVPQHIIFPGSLPFDPTSFNDSVEADLDVQQSNGSAPGATVLGIAAPTAGEGFLLAYSFVDEENLASIVSTSYGGCELRYTAAYNGGQDFTGILLAYHDLFVQGNAQGITFLFSSGDEGGLECPPVGYFTSGPGLNFKSIPSVGFWADDPNVTAVGGTSLVTSFIKGSLKSTYISESEFADALPPEDPYNTGNLLTNDVFGSTGGESVLWAKPAYQNLVNTGTKGRAVPDISMHMGGLAANESYVQEVFGQLVGLVGTSASSPEFAGLLAVESESLGGARFGNVNPLLYTLAKENTGTSGPFYHQNIPGFNGVVHVAGTTTYNVNTGVGTPRGNRFILQPQVSAAGNPRTASNP